MSGISSCLSCLHFCFGGAPPLKEETVPLRQQSPAGSMQPNGNFYGACQTKPRTQSRSEGADAEPATYEAVTHPKPITLDSLIQIFDKDGAIISFRFEKGTLQSDGVVTQTSHIQEDKTCNLITNGTNFDQDLSLFAGSVTFTQKGLTPEMSEKTCKMVLAIRRAVKIDNDQAPYRSLKEIRTVVMLNLDLAVVDGPKITLVPSTKRTVLDGQPLRSVTFSKPTREETFVSVGI